MIQVNKSHVKSLMRQTNQSFPLATKVTRLDLAIQVNLSKINQKR